MSSSSSNNAIPANSWQQKLQDSCAAKGWQAPTYSIASDRRGGRTAWSSTVEVQGQFIAARFWYDGQYVHNAKEDAAEQALRRLFPTQQPQQQHDNNTRWAADGYGQSTYGYTSLSH